MKKIKTNYNEYEVLAEYVTEDQDPFFCEELGCRKCDKHCAFGVSTMEMLEDGL